MKVNKVSTKAPFPELRGKLGAMTYPAIAEVKYDGEYNIIIYHDDDGSITCDTLNKYGKTRTHFPAIDKIAKRCREGQVREAVFLCELYTDGGLKGALYDLLGRKEDDSLNIAVFDATRILFKHDSSKPVIVGETNDITANSKLIDRREALMNLLIDDDLLANMQIVMNKDEVERHFKSVVDGGWEGTVIKSLDGRLTLGPCAWVKMKYKDQCNYTVAEIDPVKERIEVTVPDPHNQKGVRVGVKVMNKDKVTLRAGDTVTIEHQGVLDSGSLRHPVFKGKV